RLVFPSLRSRPAHGGFAHEHAKIDAALAAGVGGFILFGGDRESVTALTAELRRAAARPLLIGADLERGAAQQVGGLTELPPPAALGDLGDVETTHTAGVISGTEARSVGVNWAFAPVCDLDAEPRNPIVQTRSFGADPCLVGEHAVAWIRGCQEQGVLAGAKHYPGHGRTTPDSHAGLARVTEPPPELARCERAAASWDRGPDQGEPDLAGHAAFADGLADRVMRLVRGTTLVILAPLAVSIVDDDVGGPYVVGPRDIFARELREHGVGTGDAGRGTRVVLVYAEPRSWKGRADLGARSLRALRRLAPGAALVVLFAHP